jgi:hypothetical protein
MARSVTAVITIFGLFAICASAQGQIRGYRPPGGATLPGQLEYFRPQSGVLDQYNQFVAPRENLSNQMRSLAVQQNADFRAVQSQINQRDMVRESEAAATGTAAGFMNYSHYFGARATSSAGYGRQITPRGRYATTLPGVGTGGRLPNGIGSGFLGW